MSAPAGIDLMRVVRHRLSAEIAAVHVFAADATTRGQQQRLAALQAHETQLWDALGNVASLPPCLVPEGDDQP